MIKTVGIVFKDGGRIYVFDPNNYELSIGDKVIVETERGFQFGTVSTEIIEKSKGDLKNSLKQVLRLATDKDIEQYESNLVAAQEAFKECEKLIKKYNLNMKLIDASFTFEREQLMFHFLADSRIDFRELAKNLASKYRTRIELRQIGVRDKAKEIGGIGPCGQILCCKKFLENFDSVSINMAKCQNLSLNPNKINGSCGRLLCCLTYENDIYEESRKGLPSIGEKIRIGEKEGKVIDLNILKKTYTIKTDADEYITMDVKK